MYFSIKEEMNLDKFSFQVYYFKNSKSKADLLAYPNDKALANYYF